MADTGNAARPQLDLQVEALTSLNAHIPCNPQGSSAASSLRSLLQELQKATFTDALKKSYSEDRLEKIRDYAHQEFAAMGRTNRLRMESLVGLASEDMHKTMFEALFLFDVNAEGNSLSVEEKTKNFDEDGKPVYKTHTYPVFFPQAPHGIDGVERFLPANVRHEEEGGIHHYLKETYPDLVGQFQQAADKPIKALTTIGSLGGIGHKPDSDMDAQIILDTYPDHPHCWNDGNFFVALIMRVVDDFYKTYWERILKPERRNELHDQACQVLLDQYADGLSPEEQRVIDLIFESSFRQESRKLMQEELKQLSGEEQSKLFRQQLAMTLRDFPDAEAFLPQLQKFFPFLKQPAAELQGQLFRFSLKQLTLDKVLLWLTQYYREQFLGTESTKQVLSQAGVEDAAEPQQRKALVEHIQGNPLVGELVVEFMHEIVSRISHDARSKIPEIVQILKSQFPGITEAIGGDFVQKLWARLDDGFREHMANLVEAFNDWEAKQKEVALEYPIHQKVYQAEAYLTQKYPSTEIHFFTNILRKQRAGQHTPFLVSPEGSMAYSLMLNDFLLNPATVLCGTMPMPFDLPREFKLFASVGMFPGEEWTLKQYLDASAPLPGEEPEAPEEGEGGAENAAPADPGEFETFTLQHLPNWGETSIPREKFLEHALPIFLRESEKVSHRNLPKALLNCWWLEMIVVLDTEDEPPTSLTRLLWNPDRRHFVRENIQGEITDALLDMEKKYPQLVLDPWWLKFTEMFSRFESYEQDEDRQDFSLSTLSMIQKQILFCFAQHLRLSDIINYENQGKAVWLDENANWRAHAMVDYYNYFFSNPRERQELIRFMQGRDDAGNRMEKLLKQLFLESMQRVEKKLCAIGKSNALQTITTQLQQLSKQEIDTEKATKFLNPLLALVNQRVSIEDRKVLLKVKNKQPLNKLEKLQATLIYEDHQKMKNVVMNIADYFKQFGVELDETWVRKAIIESRVRIAGDPLENVIFKYHFERNFERKPFQVPLPISKSLSIPRSRIKLAYSKDSGRWSFSSMMSRKDSGGSGGDSTLPMFHSHLAEGLARCVLSGYIGFGGRNLTSFDKSASMFRSETATNPITGQDLMNLGQEIADFFGKMHVKSRELLENVHYIRDVFIACHVNRFNTLSLVVRDNLAEQFVISFDIRDIKIPKVPANLKMGFDEELPRFFMRLNHRQCRMLLLKHLAALRIPLLADQPPRLRTWVNPGKFDLPVAPKFAMVYINGIANTLLPANGIGTREFLIPPPLATTFDEMGREAIRLHTEGVSS